MRRSGLASGCCKGLGAATGAGGGGGATTFCNGGGLGGEGGLGDPKHILFFQFINKPLDNRALTCFVHDHADVIAWRWVNGWEGGVEVIQYST